MELDNCWKKVLPIPLRYHKQNLIIIIPSNKRQDKATVFSLKDSNKKLILITFWYCWPKFLSHQNKKVAATLERWGMTRQFDKLEEVFLNNLMRVFHSIKKDRKKQFVGKDIYFTASRCSCQKKTIANRFSILQFGKKFLTTICTSTKMKQSSTCGKIGAEVGREQFTT